MCALNDVEGQRETREKKNKVLRKEEKGKKANTKKAPNERQIESKATE